MPYKYSGAPTIAEVISQEAERNQASQSQELQALREMLKQQRDQESMDARIQKVKELRQSDPNTSWNIEGVSANSPQPNPMQLLGLQEKVEARNDRDLTKLGERVSKANIPTSIAALKNLEQGTAQNNKGGILSDPNYKVKSTGPVANTIRGLPGGNTALNIGESVGLMPKGSQQEMQLVQRLLNQDIRNMSGTAVSVYEQGRQNVEKGMTGAGDPNLIKLGIKQMQDAIGAESQNIKASTRPSVVKTFEKQGGELSLADLLTKRNNANAGSVPNQQSINPRARLEELRRKARGN